MIGGRTGIRTPTDWVRASYAAVTSHSRRYCRYCLPTALRQAVLHSQDLVVVFTEVVGRRLTPYLALETTTSLVSCELQGGGLSPLALTVKPFFLTNKKAESFWDSASSFKNSFLSLFYFIIYPVEPLNEEAACSLLSYPNRRICVAGMAIAVAFTRTGVCQDCVSVMSEQVVNDKVDIEISLPR